MSDNGPAGAHGPAPGGGARVVEALRDEVAHRPDRLSHFGA